MNLVKALKVGTVLAVVFLLTAVAYAMLFPPERVITEERRPGGGEGRETTLGEGGNNTTGNRSGSEAAYAPPSGEEEGGAEKGVGASSVPLVALIFLTVAILLILLPFTFRTKGRGLSDLLRVDILHYLSVFPGATPRELSAEFQISPSSVNHHLRVMGRAGEVFVIKGRKHLYVFPSTFSYKQAEKIVEAKDKVGKVNDKVFSIVEAMRDGSMTQKEISQLTSISPSTVSYLISKMEEADLIAVERKNGVSRYYLKGENLWKVPEIYHRVHTTAAPRRRKEEVLLKPLSTSPPPPSYPQQPLSEPPEGPSGRNQF